MSEGFTKEDKVIVELLHGLCEVLHKALNKNPNMVKYKIYVTKVELELSSPEDIENNPGQIIFMVHANNANGGPIRGFIELEPGHGAKNFNSMSEFTTLVNTNYNLVMTSKIPDIRFFGEKTSADEVKAACKQFFPHVSLTFSDNG